MHGIENSRFRGRKMKLFDLKWIVKLFQETYNFTRKIYHRYFFILNISSPIFLRIKSYIIQRWKMLLGNHELLFSNILQNVKPSTATHVVEQQRHFNITSFISMQTMHATFGIFNSNVSLNSELSKSIFHTRLFLQIRREPEVTNDPPPRSSPYIILA